MALDVPGLAEALAASRRSENPPAKAAQDFETAVLQFWSTGTGPAGSSPIPAPASGSIQGELASLYRSLPPAPQAARQTAQLVDRAMLQIILSGGGYGAHISLTTGGPSALASALERVYSSPAQDATQTTKAEAQAIHDHAKTAIATGSGPPNSPPVTGPIT